jgi:hypothetical protein
VYLNVLFIEEIAMIKLGKVSAETKGAKVQPSEPSSTQPLPI